MLLDEEIKYQLLTKLSSKLRLIMSVSDQTVLRGLCYVTAWRTVDLEEVWASEAQLRFFLSTAKGENTFASICLSVILRMLSWYIELDCLMKLTTEMSIVPYMPFTTLWVASINTGRVPFSMFRGPLAMLFSGWLLCSFSSWRVPPVFISVQTSRSSCNCTIQALHSQ